MSTGREVPEGLVWATRGRSWGFRFLIDGGLADPLPTYEHAFLDAGYEPTAWRSADGKVALRFPDPLGRRDAAGRTIPHEFVVFGDLANEVRSVEQGRHRIWPLVAEAYASVWEMNDPPSAADLHFGVRDDTTTSS